MNFRLYSVSSMYEGYIDSFYRKHPDAGKMPHDIHKKLLLDDTTEYAGSYLKNFRKQGIEADISICNDPQLQRKWGLEHELNTENPNDILMHQIKSFSPDVLWIENLSYVTKEFLVNIRKKVPSIRLVVANHCSPFNPKVLDGLTEVDFMVTCTPGMKSLIESMGKRAYLVYHAFDTDLLKRLRPPENGFANGFTFSGSLITGGDFHARRIKLIEHILKENVEIGLYVNLEKNYRIRAKQAIYLISKMIKNFGVENAFKDLSFLRYGKTWVNSYSSSLIRHIKPPVYGIEMLNLFLDSKIVLNFHIGVAGDYAGNMRMFEVTGVGSCLLTDNKKNIGELFEAGKEIVVYDSEEDCVEKVKWLLDHDEERKKIALAGHLKTMNNHTVVNRSRQIIELISEELKISDKGK